MQQLAVTRRAPSLSPVDWGVRLQARESTRMTLPRHRAPRVSPSEKTTFPISAKSSMPSSDGSCSVTISC